ncbi:MAG TPA: hypothetical protein VNS32_11515 [Flavisolibacter sp.]|nr:hypothetical protein [Flavisolibacter sp.]
MSKDKFWNLIAKDLTEGATTKYPNEPEGKIRFNPEQSFMARHKLDFYELGFLESQYPADGSYHHWEKIIQKGSALHASDITSSKYNPTHSKGKSIGKFSTCKASKYRLILSESLPVLINSGSITDYNGLNHQVSLYYPLRLNHHNNINMHHPDYLNSS